MNQLKKTLIWILLLTKRYLKKPLFIITILSIPLLSFGLKNMSGKDEKIMRVAIYEENVGANPMADEIVDALCNRESSSISFYRVDSTEGLDREVQNGTAVCGYHFPAQFAKHLTNYIQNKQDGLPFGTALIQCVMIKDRNFVRLANEIVFSEIYDDFSIIALKNYMTNSTYLETFTEDDWEELLALRNQYDSLDIDFFSFYYADGSENKLINNANEQSYLTLPVRGLVYALILLAAMSGAILLFRDMESGFFDKIPLKRRNALSYLYIMLPTVMSGIIGYFGIVFSGTSENVWMDLYNTILYIFMTTGLIAILHLVLNNLNRFVSILPIFIIINLIVCPVFINIQSAVPSAEYIKWVLPVNHGIRGPHSITSRMLMFLVGCLGFIICLKASHKRRVHSK